MLKLSNCRLFQSLKLEIIVKSLYDTYKKNSSVVFAISLHVLTEQLAI